MATPLRVLILEDRAADALLMVDALRQGGFEPAWERVETEADYLGRLDPPPELILADYDLPQYDGLRALRALLARGLDVPFIVVTGSLEERALECMREGAADYLLKDRLARLGPAVARALAGHAERDAKRRAEAALRQSEERYRLITESSHDVIALLDLTGRLRFVNGRARQLTGYDPEELRDRSVFELFTPEGAARVAARLAAVQRGEAVPPMIELPLVRKDGRLVPIEASITSVVRDGRVVGRLAVVRDVSERTQAAARLEEVARRAETRAQRLGALGALTRLITLMEEPEAVCQAVAETTVTLLGARVAHVWVDDRGEQLLRALGSAGAEPETERQLLDVTVVPYDQGMPGQIARARVPEYITDAHDDPRWLNARYIRALGLHGYAGLPLISGDRVQGVLSVLFAEPRQFPPEDRELMRLLADEAAIAIHNAQLVRGLKSRNLQLETLLDISRQLVRIQPMPSLLEQVAAAAGRLLGADTVAFLMVEGTELVLAHRWGEPIPTRPRLELRDSVSGLVVQSRQPLLIADPADDSRVVPEHRLVFRQLGHRTWLGVPVVTGERVVAVLGALSRRPRAFSAEQVEVAVALAAQAAAAIENARLYQETERAYQELSRTQAQLVQAQKMEAVGRLAGGIAHDFNNLLAVILGHSELMLGALPPGDATRQDAEVIGQTANRAATLTRQLLAFSRRQLLQPQVLDLNHLVGDVATMLRRLIGEEIELETRLLPGIASVMADPGQLEQVVMNLAVNARDAMPRGGRLVLETGEVALDADAAKGIPEAVPGRYVLLTVSDTGEGMSPDVQAHVFEPFFTSKGPGKGTGLGLSTVYGIVRQHEGAITVESAPGRGTAFRLYLPQVHEPARPLEAGPDRSAAPTGTETLLVVEDEVAVRGVLHKALSLLGYRVLEAAEGRQALERARAHPGPIDLLVTDVVMPGLGGPELAERLAELHPETRVLYVSGYTDDTLGRPGRLRPGVALLDKPFTLDALARAVREVLDAPPPAPAAT